MTQELFLGFFIVSVALTIPSLLRTYWLSHTSNSVSIPIPHPLPLLPPILSRHIYPYDTGISLISTPIFHHFQHHTYNISGSTIVFLWATFSISILHTPPIPSTFSPLGCFFYWNFIHVFIGVITFLSYSLIPVTTYWIQFYHIKNNLPKSNPFFRPFLSFGKYQCFYFKRIVLKINLHVNNVFLCQFPTMANYQ